MLPIAQDIFIYGYCLAQNKKDADDVVVWSQSKKKPYVRLPEKNSLPAAFIESKKRSNTALVKLY